MKKTLLIAVAAFAALTMQAQTWTGAAKWTQTFTPVDAADQLAQTHTTLDYEGNVFTTGTYNREITFGKTILTNDDKLTSAYLAKYNADGTESWAVGLYGASVIRSLMTDGYGNVFIAGSLADEVVFNSVDGKSQSVKGMAEVSAMVTGFVAKYDKDGNLQTVRTIIPTPNENVAASGLYYPEPTDVYFTPQRLQVSGGKVYVSAVYSGDVKIDNVNWEGRYLNIFDFMYADIASVGVLSLSADNLSNATSVATLKAKENLAYVQQNPESVNFVADGNTVYLGFVGKGLETLTTISGDTDFQMQLPNDETGNVEHAFILAKIADGTTTSKVYHVAMHDKSYGTDKVGAMALDGGQLFVGGTFYNELGFDTKVTSKGSADIFVASINPADLTVNWAVADGYDEGDITKYEETFHAMTVNNKQVFIAAADREKTGQIRYKLTYNVSADGTLTKGDNGNYVSLYDNGRGLVAAITNAAPQTTVTVYGAVADAIEAVGTTANHADDAVYTLDGCRVSDVSNLPKGIYVVGNKKVVVK